MNLRFTTTGQTTLPRQVKINLPPVTQPSIVTPLLDYSDYENYVNYENEVEVIKSTDFDPSEYEPTKCIIPISCCLPGGIGENYCGTNIKEPPYLTGCYEKTTMFFVNSTAAIAGIWLILWGLMMLQIIAARFTIRRIRLERKFAKQWLKAQNQWQRKISSNDTYNQQNDNEGIIFTTPFGFIIKNCVLIASGSLNSNT